MGGNGSRCEGVRDFKLKLAQSVVVGRIYLNPEQPRMPADWSCRPLLCLWRFRAPVKGDPRETAPLSAQERATTADGRT